jgi:hypothetical protein
MYPVSYDITNGTIKILFVCSVCGKKHHNKRADDDDMGNIDAFITLYT